jgi:hypothetical protein
VNGGWGWRQANRVADDVNGVQSQKSSAELNEPGALRASAIGQPSLDEGDESHCAGHWQTRVEAVQPPVPAKRDAISVQLSKLVPPHLAVTGKSDELDTGRAIDNRRNILPWDSNGECDGVQRAKPG